MQIEKLKSQILSSAPESALEMLFQHYLEHHPQDTVQMMARFEQLEEILSKLTLQEHSQVWDLTCGLCTDHEQTAFYRGLQTGVRLMEELDGLDRP